MVKKGKTIKRTTRKTSAKTRTLAKANTQTQHGERGIIVQNPPEQHTSKRKSREKVNKAERNISSKDEKLPPPKIDTPEQTEPPRGVCPPLRKPVILFYGFEKDQTLNVNVGCTKNFIFDSIYPKPSVQTNQIIGWKVKFIETGSIELLDNNKKYPYLFWEARPKTPISQLFSMEKFFCFSSDEVGIKLDLVLERMGLSFQERCDMITYWLPSMTKKKFVKVSFIEREIYERVFPMTVEPKPKDSLRLAMLFQSVDEFEESSMDFESITISTRNSFESSYIVEWGGIEMI